MKHTRRSKRPREQATTQLHPIELATLVEASAGVETPTAPSPDAETIEMVALVELDGVNPRDVETVPLATGSAGVARDDVETALVVELESPRDGARNAVTRPLPGVERGPAVREDAETEEIIELANGSSELPPPIVTARGPRRSRGRMPKLTR